MIKKTRTSKKAQPRVNWPWWKVYLAAGHRVRISGHTKVLLSKHFLNLRPATLAAAEKINAKTRRGKAELQQHNIKSIKTNLAALRPVQPSVQTRRSEHSIYLLLRAMAADIRNYGSAVGQVLTWPSRRLMAWWRRIMLEPLFFRWRESNRWSQVIIFIALSLLVTLPVRGIAIWHELNQQRDQVIQLAQAGAEQIKIGTDNLQTGDLDKAEINFQAAANTFTAAAAVLQVWPDRVWQLLRLIPGKTQQYASGNYLVASSREISEAAALALATWRTIKTAASTDPANLVDNFQLTKPALENIKQHLDLANFYLDKVEPGMVHAELRSAVTVMQDELRQITAQLDNFVTFPQFIEQIVSTSTDTSQTFVFIFQNSSELRPSGGFMGSLALMKITNGQVTEVNIPGGGPYDYQGQLSRLIRPPEPLRLVRGTWQLQDANWWFDFPTSARKIMWFLQQSGAPPAAGTIAITSRLVEELLKLTGPIELPSWRKILTAENFYRETQSAVEIEYDRQANRPKQFIADLAPLLLDKILNLPPVQQPALLLALEQGLVRRDIQIYLTDSKLQEQGLAYGWGGEIKQTPLDYLAVVRTNIGGGKTDLVTADKISHTVDINDAGAITAAVTYTRRHQGQSDDIFTSRRNVDYVRFYVPPGAELLTADGFTPPPADYYRPVPAGAEFDEDLLKNERLIGYHQASGTRISEEFDKTVFANWLTVAPGEARTVQLVYRLPFVLRPDSSWQDLRRYQVYFQHQAGTGPIEFSSQVKLPTGWRLRWQNASAPLSLNNQTRSITFTSDWIKDDYYALIVEKVYD